MAPTKECWKLELLWSVKESSSTTESGKQGQNKREFTRPWRVGRGGGYPSKWKQHMQRPCGGWKEEGSLMRLDLRKQSRAWLKREEIGVSRCQTRQIFGDHVKNFAFYPFYPIHGKIWRGDAKERSGAIGSTFWGDHFATRVEVEGELGGRGRWLEPGK